MWFLFQYNASKFHLLIKQIREGVAIVSEQLINCIYTHLLIEKTIKGGSGYCFSTMHQTPLIN